MLDVSFIIVELIVGQFSFRLIVDSKMIDYEKPYLQWHYLSNCPLSRKLLLNDFRGALFPSSQHIARAVSAGVVTEQLIITPYVRTNLGQMRSNVQLSSTVLLNHGQEICQNWVHRDDRRINFSRDVVKQQFSK